MVPSALGIKIALNGEIGKKVNTSNKHFWFWHHSKGNYFRGVGQDAELHKVGL